MVHNAKPSANAAANGVVYIYYHAPTVAANAQGFSSKGWIANIANATAHAEAVVRPPKFTKHRVNAKAITNAGAGGVAHHSHPSPAVAPYVHSFSSKTWSADIANVNFLAKAVVQPPKFTEHLNNAEANAHAGAEGIAHIHHIELAVVAKDHGFSSKEWIANSANANALVETVVQPPRCPLLNAKANANAVTAGVAHINHLAPVVAANVHGFFSKKRITDANVNSLAEAPKFIDHLVTVQVGRDAELCNSRRHKMSCTQNCWWHSTLPPQCLALDNKDKTAIDLRSRTAQIHVEVAKAYAGAHHRAQHAAFPWSSQYRSTLNAEAARSTSTRDGMPTSSHHGMAQFALRM
mmetsp:Transcript_14836/g.18207  ORF Transcript_14836/g.18207 Transcript_14836/m.18207 type:complete len:350 (+) Transcript_14836:369-1418(+)